MSDPSSLLSSSSSSAMPTNQSQSSISAFPQIQTTLKPSTSLSSSSSSVLSTNQSQSNVGVFTQGPAGVNPSDGSFSVPENVWLPSIRDLYPNLQSETYFVPPLHFNRVPHDVVTIAGQTVRVLDNPPCRPRRRHRIRKLDQQLGGRVFIENPPTLQPLHVLDTDKQEDEAQQRCLQCLLGLIEKTPQVMMVLSQLRFRQYLDNCTNPIHAAAIGHLPNIKSLPEKVADGESDILIIHRHHGFIVGEMKSTGASPHFSKLSHDNQNEVIVKIIKKAVVQLENQEIVLRHLVSDLDSVRVRNGVAPVTIVKTLFMPNLSSVLLLRALDQCTSTSVPQTLLKCLDSADVTQALSKCLCVDYMGQPEIWWDNIVPSKPADPGMNNDIYERLVARFCGPATSVEIATPTVPRKVIRTFGEAVAETGLRFSSLVLIPEQVALLNRTNPEPHYIYLQGPPGCGKTVVLILKGLQWLNQGRIVHIISTSAAGSAVSALMVHQLLSGLGAAAAAGVRCCRHNYDFQSNPDDVGHAVSVLGKSAQQNAELAVIMDEIGSGVRNQFVEFINRVSTDPALSTLCVWGAGLWIFQSPPPVLVVETLASPLRCPPTVIKRAQESFMINRGHILPYSVPVHPVPTEGPKAQELLHRNQPGHYKGHPLDCLTCADNIADILIELGVGQSGTSLSYRDVFILCDDMAVDPCNNAMVQGLRKHAVPVKVMSSPLSDDDVCDLALATSDHVIITDYMAVAGLERRVVIVVGYWIGTDLLFRVSRCTSLLYLIDSPGSDVP